MIDAEGAILGRMSTEIATLLRGKHKPIWAPHVDTGDHVIVINASKLGIDPQEGDREAVPPPHRLPRRYPHREPRAPAGPRPRARRAPRRAAMLPKGPLGRQMLKKLKIYGGATHPHHAQSPSITLPERSRARADA